MHRTVLTATVFVLLTMCARDASAQWGQPWTDRGYFNINLGFDSGSDTLADDMPFTLYAEPANKGVAAGVDSGAFFDFSVGSRVWQNVSVGIGFHRGSSSGDATVTARVPNPIFFDRPRNVDLGVSELDRRERAFHIQVGYMLPINDDVSVHVFGGPSFFNVKQDVVSDVTFSEGPFPFATVGASAVVSERSDSAVGGNIGADVTYKVYETPDFKLGAGAFLRYSGASADIQLLQNTVDSGMGGLQIGFGARVRF